jgi:hypothetical protein
LNKAAIDAVLAPPASRMLCSAPWTRSLAPKRRHLNAAERRALRAADAMKYIQQYGRKAQKGGMDPNDRWLIKDLTQAIKQMDPEDFDRLLRDDED